VEYLTVSIFGVSTNICRLCITMLNFAISDLTSFLITYYCLGKVIAPNGELNTMTLRLQKQLCQANGMSASGRKADLLVTRRISRTMTMLLALLEKY
jgi:hypothetical protein